MRKRTTDHPEEYYKRKGEQAARRRAADPEKARAATRKWDQAHPRKSTETKRARDRERMRLKRQENPSFEREYAVRYRAENREALRLSTAARRRAHPEKKQHSRLKDAEWRKANPEKAALYSLRYRTRHPEKAKKNQQRWRQGHPEKVKAHHRRWRSMIRGAAISDLTAAQWKEIKDAYGNRCVYCDRKMQRLTQDHITPLSKGGNHTAHNVVPACQSCNSRKNNGAVLRPVQPLLLTVAPGHTKRKDEV